MTPSHRQQDPERGKRAELYASDDDLRDARESARGNLVVVNRGGKEPGNGTTHLTFLYVLYSSARLFISLIVSLTGFVTRRRWLSGVFPAR